MLDARARIIYEFLQNSLNQSNEVNQTERKVDYSHLLLKNM